MVGVFLTRILVLFALFVAIPAFACEEDVKCDECAKPSEFSWNPSGKYITTSLTRFYELENEIRVAYDSKNYGEAKDLIKIYLRLAKKYKCNWNYGNAIHDANRYLGLISLKHGDIDSASEYLIKAGKSTGSPQLDTFGPELDLANELLKLGRGKDVAIYLKDIKKFWNDGALIEEWLVSITNGESPKLSQFKSKKLIIQIIINYSISILIGTVFLWLSMLFVNRFIVDKHTQIKCPFWKLLVAVAVSSALSFIPIIGWLLSIIVFFILVMIFTGAFVFEVLVMVLIAKLADFLVGIALLKYFSL